MLSYKNFIYILAGCISLNMQSMEEKEWRIDHRETKKSKYESVPPLEFLAVKVTFEERRKNQRQYDCVIAIEAKEAADEVVGIEESIMRIKDNSENIYDVRLKAIESSSGFFALKKRLSIFYTYEEMQQKYALLPLSLSYNNVPLIVLCRFLDTEMNYLEKLFIKDYINNSSKIPSIENFKCIVTYVACIRDIKKRNMNIQEIPKGISYLKVLNTLCLSNNQIKHLPKEMAALQYLKELDLSCNEIENIDILMEIKTLQKLCLNNNKIKAIPNKITNLKKLSLFNLNYNKIKNIPNIQETLDCLTFLHLNNNQIREIPKEISNIANLEVLNLSNNRIAEMPRTIKELSSCIFYLEGNPLIYDKSSGKPKRIAKKIDQRHMFFF